MISENISPVSEKSIDFNLCLDRDSMEGSKASTPTSDYTDKKATYDSRKVYFAPPTCPIKRMNSLLNKITDLSFQRISDEMLVVNLLDDPLEDEAIPEDKDKMLPIVKTFIANICQPACGPEIMNVYAKAFSKLKDNWKGRQGRILTEIMMAELSKFFTDYSKNLNFSSVDDSVETSVEDKLAEEAKKRLKCFKLCNFVSFLYKDGAVSLRLVIAILQSFFKNDKLYLEVFCKLFAACQDKLMKDETFRSKVFEKYKVFLEENSKSVVHEPMYKFMCLNILDSLK
jgi:hypothetical protein